MRGLRGRGRSTGSKNAEVSWWPATRPPACPDSSDWQGGEGGAGLPTAGATAGLLRMVRRLGVQWPWPLRHRSSLMACLLPSQPSLPPSATLLTFTTRRQTPTCPWPCTWTYGPPSTLSGACLYLPLRQPVLRAAHALTPLHGPRSELRPSCIVALLCCDPTVLASCLPPLPVQGAVGPAAHAVGMGGQRSVGARVSTLATQCLGARLTWASRRRVLTRCSRREHVTGWEQIK